MPPRIRDYLGFISFVARRFREDRCSQVAASLTYTTLLALVPTVTIALTLISAFPVFERFVQAVKAFIIANLVPVAAGKIVTEYMGEFSANAASLTHLLQLAAVLGKRLHVSGRFILGLRTEGRRS